MGLKIKIEEQKHVLISAACETECTAGLSAAQLLLASPHRNQQVPIAGGCRCRRGSCSAHPRLSAGAARAEAARLGAKVTPGSGERPPLSQ